MWNNSPIYGIWPISSPASKGSLGREEDLNSEASGRLAGLWALQLWVLAVGLRG